MESFEAKKKHDFDLEIVQEYFEKALKDDGAIVLENYLNAFKELCRFFKLAGRIFGFVAKDIEYKIKAIEFHISKNKFNYYSIQNMVEFEARNGLTHNKGLHPSGCRTLLRLHHALEFIIAFMIRIKDDEEDEKLSHIAWEVYSETLSNHHPWMTQKLAAVAVFALPSKNQLINVMCKHNYKDVMKLLSAVCQVGQNVYDAIEDVLKMNNLLVIP